MSIESAKHFVQRMQEDKAFAGAVEKLSGKEVRAAFIKQDGFDFTKEELTDAALEMNAVDVVGGRCCGTKCERDSPNPFSMLRSETPNPANMWQIPKSYSTKNSLGEK